MAPGRPRSSGWSPGSCRGHWGRDAGGERTARLLRSAGARCPRPEPHHRGAAPEGVRAGIGRCASQAGRGVPVSGDDVDKKVRALSGGEKTRLVMAIMLLNPPNFLVLDEPTNHLDLATKEMLIDSLRGFEGTLLFVSHDRAFLRAAEQPGDRTRWGERRRCRAAPLSGLIRGVRGTHRSRGAGGSRVARPIGVG